jgi:hypothetical protein
VVFGSVNVDKSMSFDAESAIAEFLADAGRSSLELPSLLTADQRKRAKKLADQHKELRCESYGFGAERQLHLFKRPAETKTLGHATHASEVSTPAKAAGNVSVKNTFIDDWIALEGDQASGPEPIMFRSMPPVLQCSREGNEQPQQGDGAAAKEETEASSQRYLLSRSTSGNVSGAGSSASNGCSSVGSPAQSNRDLPSLTDKGIQVRNTFIHFEADDTADARIVQSMPHGMFRQCLEQEAAMPGLDVAIAEDAPPRSPSGEEQQQSSFPSCSTPIHTPRPRSAICSEVGFGYDAFTPGTRVVIDGLLKAPAFNGRAGTIQSFDMETGRYSVLLSFPSGPGGACQTAKVKADNLRLCAPAPLFFSPEDCISSPVASECWQTPCGSVSHAFRTPTTTMPPTPSRDTYAPR